jgi:hypothetical protein
MKSALGENPKRVYGERKQLPSTRLGTAAVIRDALVKAANYLAKRDRGDDPPAERDLRWEALGLVLQGEIPWRQHCHRADDIATPLRLADEFGYRLVIDHGTEAVLLADQLGERGVSVLIGPLLTSRSKVELRNRSLANPGRLAAAGVELGIITDHPVVPVHLLHVQAALAVREGLDPAAALRAVTLTPARVLGLEDRLGSLRAVGQGCRLAQQPGDEAHLEHAEPVGAAAGLGGEQADALVGAALQAPTTTRAPGMLWHKRGKDVGKSPGLSAPSAWRIGAFDCTNFRKYGGGNSKITGYGAFARVDIQEYAVEASGSRTFSRGGFGHLLVDSVCKSRTVTAVAD